MNIVNSKSSNVTLAIYKVIATIMIIGSLAGILSNSRHLVRYGMTLNSSGYAIAGCLVSVLIIWASIHILRLPFLKTNKPT
jgi:hypothetical protein